MGTKDKPSNASKNRVFGIKSPGNPLAPVKNTAPAVTSKKGN